MSDKELLELAAKAAGIDGDYSKRANSIVHPDGYWNPLTDDGDALRLAVRLGLIVDTDYNGCTAVGSATLCETLEPHNGNPCAATRRAIVRAAAEIGRVKHDF